MNTLAGQYMTLFTTLMIAFLLVMILINAFTMYRIRSLLLSIVDMIDKEEFKVLSDIDIENIVNIIKKPTTMNITQVYNYLGVSRSRFYELRKEGIIPEPGHKRGSLDKVYSRELIEKIKLDHPDKFATNQ